MRFFLAVLSLLSVFSALALIIYLPGYGPKVAGIIVGFFGLVCVNAAIKEKAEPMEETPKLKSPA